MLNQGRISHLHRIRVGNIVNVSISSHLSCMQFRAYLFEIFVKSENTRNKICLKWFRTVFNKFTQLKRVTHKISRFTDYI